MSTLSEAQDARDALIAELGLDRTWHPVVVGVGIAKEGEGYVVAVDVTALVDLPDAIGGVPVRAHLSGRPVPQTETRP